MLGRGWAVLKPVNSKDTCRSKYRVRVMYVAELWCEYEETH